MTYPANNSVQGRDPEGSIFLPKTTNPEREFDGWTFELLLGRGLGADKSPEELMNLYEQLQEARTRHLGTRAINAV